LPRHVLIQRGGKDRRSQEAIESHIGGWFWNAAARERLRPVAQPEFEFELPDSDPEDRRFPAAGPGQAKPELGDWTQLEVPYREPEVPEEIVQQELQVLQS